MHHRDAGARRSADRGLQAHAQHTLDPTSSGHSGKSDWKELPGPRRVAIGEAEDYGRSSPRLGETIRCRAVLRILGGAEPPPSPGPHGDWSAGQRPTLRHGAILAGHRRLCRETLGMGETELSQELGRGECVRRRTQDARRRSRSGAREQVRRPSPQRSLSLHAGCLQKIRFRTMTGLDADVAPSRGGHLH